MDLKSWWPLVIAATGIIGTFAVMQYRMVALEDDVRVLKQEPLKLVLLERDVKGLKCKVGNLKNILKSQGETECD